MTETSGMKENGTSRRTIFAGAGAIGVAGMLAACGSDEETPQGNGTNPTPTGNAAPPTTGAPGGDAGGFLAKKSDIPVGGGKIFGEQLVVVTQPTAGQFVAFSAMCTHQQCVLANVSNGTINCGCHQSKFSVTDGSVKGGPATQALPKKELKIEGDDINLP